MGRAIMRGFGDLLLRPHRTLRSPSYWMVASVYAVTYSTANLIDTVCERKLDREDQTTAAIHGTSKLIGTTAANMGAGIWKDSMFAKMFGAATSAAAVATPRTTIGLFALRDLATIGGAFALPNTLASIFIGTGAVEERYASETAQFVSPLAMQLVCTPLHLLALQYFNARDATLIMQCRAISPMLAPTLVVRLLRSMPAYGIGGVMNTSFVHRGRDRNLHEFYLRPREETEPDDAGPWPAPAPARRRRVMDCYTHRLDGALELLGEVDPAAVESAGGLRGVLLRQMSSGLIRRDSGIERPFEPAQAGYYPELAQLAEEKVHALHLEAYHPLAGLLGDAQDVPDVGSDLALQLQRLNSVKENCE